MTLKKTSTRAPGKATRKPAVVAGMPELSLATAAPAALLSEVRVLILATRQTVAQGVNSALVLLYWHIGQRIRSDILKAKRADYGEQIFRALSEKLTAEFSRGFTERNLASMVRCAEAFPDAKILHALRTNLSWTHLLRPGQRFSV